MEADSEVKSVIRGGWGVMVWRRGRWFQVRGAVVLSDESRKIRVVSWRKMKTEEGVVRKGEGGGFEGEMRVRNGRVLK